MDKFSSSVVVSLFGLTLLSGLGSFAWAKSDVQLNPDLISELTGLKAR